MTATAVATESASTHASVRRAARARPVIWWAAAGAGFLVLQLYVYVAWVVSGQASPTPTGSDAVPSDTRLWAWIAQVGSVLALCVFIAYVAVRSRRERRLTWDGILGIATLSFYWQDPLLNFLRPQFLYNSYMLNLGSWVEQIPGWVSPLGHRLPEPLLYIVPVYVYLGPLVAMLETRFLTLLARRRPQLTTIQLFLCAWAFAMVFDVVLETVFIRTSLYANAGTIHALSLFAGSVQQFPLYETVFLGAMWGSFGVLRYQHCSGRSTVVDAGIEGVRLGGRLRSTIRILAMVGFVNIAFLAYNVAVTAPALYTNDYPSGYPSYMINGMCGQGTVYRCPGDGVPIYVRGSRPDPPPPSG